MVSARHVLHFMAAGALGMGLAGCGFLAVPAPHKEGEAPLPLPSAATGAAPTRAATIPAAPSNATVKAGETLYQIARSNNVPIRALIDANHLEPPYILHPGQQLVVPHPQVHVVTPGETLYGVSRRYGVDSSALVRANGLIPPYKILVGQQLIMPSPVVVEPSAPVVASATEIQRVELLPPQSSGARPAVTQTPPSESSRAIPVAPRLSQSASPPSSATQPVSDSPHGVTVMSLPPPPSASRSPTVRTFQSVPESTSAAVNPNSSSEAADGTPSAVPLPPPSADAKIASLSPPETTPSTTRKAASGRFLWPVKGRIVSNYGPKEGGLFNDGINIAAHRGQSVVAAEDGVVVYAGNEIRGFGNLVLIKHANGWMTAYGHNETLLVKRGDRVRRGQPIAKAGSSGSVTSPQVHFEIRRDSRAVDPMKYLTVLSS